MAATATAEQVRPQRTTLKIAAGIVLLVILGSGRWWFGSPDGSSTGYSSLNTNIPVACDVEHHGFPYLAHGDSFVVGPGQSFTGRFGPHDVRVSFLDDSERHGLEIETASRQLFNSGTVGATTGSQKRTVHVTRGPGLGTLTVTCEQITREGMLPLFLCSSRADSDNGRDRIRGRAPRCVPLSQRP